MNDDFRPVHLPSSGPSRSPYSPGFVSGPFIHVSGQVGINPETNDVVAGGFRDQLRQTLANVERVLSQVQLDRTAIIRTTVYLTDVGDFAVLNEEYLAFFGDVLPARTTIGIAALAVASLVVEVDAIAWRGTM